MNEPRRLTVGGAVVGALIASSCCLGPLVVGALGIGGAGAFAALATYRPYLLVMTGALLGAGFYLTYRRPNRAAACGCERRRLGRRFLWVVTIATAAVALSPLAIAKLADHSMAPAVPAVPTQRAVIHVGGVDCQGCAIHLRRALLRVGGLHDLKLDVEGQRVTVTYQPSPGRLDAYAAAIRELGYEASLPADARP
jgi:mercuric ion transport protein